MLLLVIYLKCDNAVLKGVSQKHKKVYHYTNDKL